ncbi:MAG: thiamine phosphate synthase [Chloroflexota bacterium]|nr:thiamine phosphate synthase [Chloroflexota bacterium]
MIPSAPRVALPPGLYVITDRGLSRGRSQEEVVRAAVKGGAAVVQLREKMLPRPELLQLALRLRDICREGGAAFIVNDDPELAAEVEADGVHVGPEDPSPAEARRIVGRTAAIGWSVKGSAELAREAAGLTVDYVAAGAIFPTQTKAGAQVVGVHSIRSVKEASGLPVAAIGGITLENVASVIRAGADWACVVSAVVAADDVEAAARSFTETIEQAMAQRS